ncbi:MAG: Holliday junction resolvase RuvX, partial [Planctomycetota bacterium]
VPFVFFDERFTTKEAKRLMQDSELSFAKRKKRVDQLAAHLILNNYLENRRAQEEWERRQGSQNEALDDGPDTL